MFYFVFQNSQSYFVIITARVGGIITTNNEGRWSKIVTNKHSNQQMHLKRLSHTRYIKFLQVSALGRHLQGIQSTKACKYKPNILGITEIKC